VRVVSTVVESPQPAPATARTPFRHGDGRGYVGARRQPGNAGRRRAGPGGLRRAGRLRELVGTGLVDSFGMSLGWTVLVLVGLARGGIVEAALYNAAMLFGVMLSAPVTGWLARRFGGRVLLRGAGVVELLLRVGVLGGLVAGLPAPLVALGVTAMHVAAWAGFAAMRAEVTAVDPRSRAMTRYALGIAAVEAAGTGVAALVPFGPAGYPTGWLLGAVLAVYGGSLIPTIVSARRARVAARVASRRVATSPRLPVSVATLAIGGAIALLASGPTLLAVPLTTELYSRAWVVGTAIAFSVGCLLASTAVEVVARLRLPTTVRWSLWGLVMLVGWIAAPVSPFAVLVAQFLAGVALTAFEGDMDARVAERAPSSGVTTALAYSAATRAMGSALAVRALPAIVAAQAIGTASAMFSVLLAAAAVSVWAAPLLRRASRRAVPAG
jgi:MFS family permease